MIEIAAWTACCIVLIYLVVQDDKDSAKYLDKWDDVYDQTDLGEKEERIIKERLERIREEEKIRLKNERQERLNKLIEDFLEAPSDNERFNQVIQAFFEANEESDD